MVFPSLPDFAFTHSYRLSDSCDINVDAILYVHVERMVRDGKAGAYDGAEGKIPTENGKKGVGKENLAEERYLHLYL